VLAIVLTVGTLNLALGFALALLVVRFSHASHAANSARVESTVAAVDVPPPDEPAETCEAWSDEWLAHLKQQGIEPATLIESLLWRVRSELEELRPRLVTADTALLGTVQLPDLAQQLSETCDAWLSQLNDWAAASSANKGDSPYPKLHGHLEELLLDHSFEVQSAGEALRDLGARDSVSNGTPAAQHEVGRLLDAVNSLRDDTDSLLAMILREEKRVPQVPESLHYIGEGNLYTRLGLEVLFDEWWAKDPDRVRLVSGVLLDIDRVRKVNDTFGADAGDRILLAFGEMLRTLVRRERGFDRVARLAGQSYFLFLGDTAARNAVNGAERIRHTIEATSFQVGESTVELTASCAVAEVGRAESLPAFLRRLRSAVKEAKRAGRNRTCVDEREGPQVVSLPQYHVKGRVIEIDTQAALEPAAAAPTA
jgi:diguanylate cyclase (GGDEF)-like protein